MVMMICYGGDGGGVNGDSDNDGDNGDDLRW
jgi:hypothetical protein